MGNKANLIANTFGRLTVIAEDGRDGGGNVMWLCQCVCGKFTRVKTGTLRYRKIVSCGCLKALNGLKHGKSKTPEHLTWLGMKDRCYNPNNKKYYLYGGRGIVVCDRWRDSFENFLADMGQRPSTKHSIDRYPNKDGNYEPSNCRWATVAEQNRNRKGNRLIEYKGITKPAIDWSIDFGMTKGAFLGRVNMGWNMEKIKSIPVLRRANTKATL